MGILRTGQTESATAFVDDFVSEGLPPVCVVSGEPTTTVLRMSRTVDAPSAGWLLLVLLGPVGWIIMALVFLTGRRSRITGFLPMNETYYRAAKARRRRAWAFALAAGVVLVAGLLLDGTAALLGPLVLVGALLLVAVVLAAIDSIGRPSIELDASRRWVTIYKVHPNFAQACRADTRRQRSATAS